jgi:hypothetical protein
VENGANILCARPWLCRDAPGSTRAPESQVGASDAGARAAVAVVRRRAAPASCVRWLQQPRHRAADDDLAAAHLGALDIKAAQLSTDELKRPLI